MTRGLIAAAVAVGLTGCVVPTQAAFDAQMSAFVGRPEVDVIMALGVPTRSTEAGGLRFIEYERRRVVGWSSPAGWYWGAPALGDYIDTLVCRLTFTLRDGRVVHFDSRGNDCVAPPPYAAPLFLSGPPWLSTALIFSARSDRGTHGRDGARKEPVTSGA